VNPHLYLKSRSFINLFLRVCVLFCFVLFHSSHLIKTHFLNLLSNVLFWYPFLDPDFDSITDPHVVAGTLKLYLRDQPEALIPPSVCADYIEATSTHSFVCSFTHTRSLSFQLFLTQSFTHTHTHTYTHTYTYCLLEVLKTNII
jgi:hypothetical protein